MKIVITLITLILLSGCSSNIGVDYQGELIKVINENKSARDSTLKAASNYKIATKILRAELERLIQLDKAYQKAIDNTNCPARM